MAKGVVVPFPLLAQRPVVFLHGFLESPSLWTGSRAALEARGIRTAAIALPGHPGCPLDLTDLHRACTANGGVASLVSERIAEIFPRQRVAVVGHSTGAMIALSLAAHHAERIERVMLVGGLRRVAPRRMRDLAIALARRPVIGPRWARWIIAAWLAHPTLFRMGFDAVSRRPIRLDLERIRTDLRGCDPEKLRLMLDWLAGQNIDRAELARITAPVTAVLGAFDPVVSAEDQLELASSVPFGKAVVCDAGHLPMLEQPEMFQKLLMAWLCDRTASVAPDRRRQRNTERPLG